ncbi:MAG: hypothetical protein ISR78_02640, partial [Spirochaetia bacterium]|nr:hypothetical protein [Spirochaetia bacterium]
MQILIISGFLGSGKTTLLLGLSEFLVRRGERVAIIENEVGEIPVDSSCLKAQGLTVRELYAGCICCSLREDLQKTIMA